MLSRISPMRFPITSEISGSFASYGVDHLCLIFYRGGKRISSFVAEGSGRTDYFSEAIGKTEFYVSLKDALERAEKEP